MLVAETAHVSNCCGMFLVNAIQAAAIRTAHEAGGDSAAAAEFRVLFPGTMDDKAVMLCARMIAGWKPFGPGRVGRYISAKLARRSESGRQRGARSGADTPTALAQASD
jgi:hypothetical protein